MYCSELYETYFSFRYLFIPYFFRLDEYGRFFIKNDGLKVIISFWYLVYAFVRHGDLSLYDYNCEILNI